MTEEPEGPAEATKTEKTERPGPAFTKKRQRETNESLNGTIEDETTTTTRKIDPKDDPRLTMVTTVNLTLMDDHLLRKLTPIDTTSAYDNRTREQQKRDAEDMRFEGKESKHRLHHHAREARKKKVQQTWKFKRMQQNRQTESKESENEEETDESSSTRASPASRKQRGMTPTDGTITPETDHDNQPARHGNDELDATPRHASNSPGGRSMQPPRAAPGRSEENDRAKPKVVKEQALSPTSQNRWKRILNEVGERGTMRRRYRRKSWESPNNSLTQPTLKPYWADDSNASKDEPGNETIAEERKLGPNGDRKKTEITQTERSSSRPGHPGTSAIRPIEGTEKKRKPEARGARLSDKENIDPGATKPVTERGNGSTSVSARMETNVGCKMADSPERYTRMRADHWF